MTIVIIIAAVLISLAIGFLVGMIYRKKVAESKIQGAENEAKRLIDLAKKEGENLKKEEIFKAKEEIMNNRKELDQEIKERRGEVQKQEARLIQKEELLERRSENFEKKELEVERRLQEVDAKKLEIEDLYAEEINKLQEIAALTKEEAKEKALELLQTVGLVEKADVFPNSLSGGQKQRCACARALVNRPGLLLADEPTGALDSHSAQMLLNTMQSINRQMGSTILMVTHDAFTASYAGRILFLRDGEIFTELVRGDDGRSAFFEKILHVLTMIGGGQSHVCKADF